MISYTVHPKSLKPTHILHLCCQDMDAEVQRDNLLVL